MENHDNLLADLPSAAAGEVFTTLLRREGLLVERIVSAGQSTPDHEPYEQDHDEWVLLLAGEAGLRLEGEPERRLGAGDQAFIPAGRRHWVTWTRAEPPTVWLAIHLPATG